MPEVNLDDLLPEDLTINYRGDKYVVPGDLDVDTATTLFRTLKEQAAAEDGEDDETTAERVAASRAFLLELFRIRQPNLESLPFGVKGTAHVILAILRHLGVLEETAGADAAAPADPTPPNRATRRTAAKPKPKPRARSSTASRR